MPVRNVRSAGVWQVRLPASTGVYGLRAQPGTRASAIAESPSRPNIDEFLRPELDAAVAPTPRTAVVVARRSPLRVPEPVTSAATPQAAPVPLAPTVATAVHPEQYAARSETRRQDIGRYAARETRSKQAQDFRGGDVIVISLSTLIIIGLIILLIILLT